MLSVLFYLRYNKKTPGHPTATVYCQVTLAGQKATPFSTGVKAQVANWQKSKSTGNPLSDKKLMLTENRINALHLRYEMEDKPYTVHDLRSGFLAPVDTPTPKPRPVTYLEMYRRYVDSKYQDGLEAESMKVLERYIKNTTAALESLGTVDLTIMNMDAERMDALRKYLLAHYAESTALKMLVYAKAVVDFAVLKKVITHSSIKPYKIGKPKDKDPVCLTIEEEKRLLEHDLAATPGLATIAGRLEKIRDMYIVMRELAIHYGDYLRLDESMFKRLEGSDVYHATRKKTDVNIFNLVTPQLQSVIDKYGGVNNLPKMSLQRYNDYIKVLFAACGIDKRATSKIARKTFSDYHTNEVPAPDPALCAMMGLTSTRSLKFYRKVDHRALLRHFKPVPKEKND